MERGCVGREIKRAVYKAIAKIKCVKAAGIPEMVKYVGNTVVE